MEMKGFGGEIARLARACAAVALIAAAASCDRDGAPVGNNATGAAGNGATGTDARGNAAAERRRWRDPVLSLLPTGVEAGERGGDTSERYEFEIAQAEAVERVAAVLGQPDETGGNPGCRTAPDFARWASFKMHFRNGRFVGWRLDGARPRLTPEGSALGIGMRRANLIERGDHSPQFRQTSRGLEFTHNGFSGIFSSGGPRAQIRELYAGETCYPAVSGALG